MLLRHLHYFNEDILRNSIQSNASMVNMDIMDYKIYRKSFCTRYDIIIMTSECTPLKQIEGEVTQNLQAPNYQFIENSAQGKSHEEADITASTNRKA